MYQTALTESGYTEKIEYQDTQLKKKKRRNRKIIWFNPPYSKHVTTSIGSQFFRILNKHFPEGHKFHKIYNRNTVKLSCSCAPNAARIIKSINSKILCHDSATSDAKECNCRDKNSCPLQKKCLTKSVVYEATLTTATQEKFKYLGLTEGTFKERYNMHKSSFRHDEQKNYTISWRIAAKGYPTKGGNKDCDLCMTEKILILSKCKEPDNNLLN